LSIRAGTFTVVDYGAEERVAAGVGHATVVRSTNGVPVVAERIMTHAGERDGEDDQDEESSEGDDRTGDIAAGPGAVVAAHRWAFPSAFDSAGLRSRFVVFNPDSERSARVTLLAVVNGREAEVDDARDVDVPPGGQVGLDGDAAGSAWVVESGAPVVVERVVLGEDGVRLAAGVGIPSGDGAVSLERLDAE
jgi:hypothetical protein